MRLRVIVSACCLLLVATACPRPTRGGGDSGTPSPAPTITSVSPDAGSPAGATPVDVVGTNFQSGAQLFFAGAGATNVKVISAFHLTAVTPAGDAGVVAVRVLNPDGQDYTLTDGFTYGQPAISNAVLENPATATDTSGASPVTLNVQADVNVPGVTGGATPGAGVLAQAVWMNGGATDFSALTHTPAMYVAPSPAHPGYDRYGGQVSLPGAMATSVSYLVTMRFSLDNGQTWTYADRDGSGNGTQFSQLSQVTVSPRLVGYCKLGGDAVTAPPVVQLKAGDPGFVVYGQVYAQGVTDQPGQGAGIQGQLGYGPPDGGASFAGWTWLDAGYNTDQHNGSNDEYQAALPDPGVGTFAFAYRFALNGGPYLYCDASGTNGFDVTKAGLLEVTPIGIDWCNLQFPASMTAQAGGSTGNIYGRVLAVRVTEGTGQGPGIAGELGYGPADAGYLTGAWSWVPAAYNTDYPPYDEYQASFTVPPPGLYNYLYRFAYDGGAKVYCDANGGDGGVTASAYGVLTSVPYTPAVASCRTVSVDNSAPASGQPVTATGSVYVPGVTNATGADAGIRAQVGVGTQGDNPESSAAWGWRDVPFARADDAGQSLYVATVAPAYSGARQLAFRFSLNDGGSWTYCDTGGNVDAGYNPALGWVLNVGVPGFDFCNLQFPSSLVQSADGGATTVYGQVWINGVTTRSAADPVMAQLGYGQKIEDPGVASSWTWVDAVYDTATCCGTYGARDNEYNASFRGVPPGQYVYAFRFTVDGGSYCYGDLDGAGNDMDGAGAQGGFNGDTAAGAPNLGDAGVTP